MHKITEKVLKNLPYNSFTDTDIIYLFKGSANSRHSLVKRALACGEILHVRKGLYCLSPIFQKTELNLYSLAERIYGPSYISLEAALSYHGWIPEAVYAITCVSAKRYKEFNTPLGIFRYFHIPMNMFYACVQRIAAQNKESFLIASPIKALIDYIYIYKKNWTNIDPVLKSLRIDQFDLQTTTKEELDILYENYPSQRVRKFIQGLKKDLGYEH